MTTKLIGFFFVGLIFFSCGITSGQRNEIISNVNQIRKQDSLLITGWYYLVDSGNGFKRQLDRDSNFYFIDPSPIVTAKDFETLEIYESVYGDLGLSMKLNESSIDIWTKATEKSINKRLAFVLNDKLLHVPNVNSVIPNGMTAINRGIYTKKELEEIMEKIKTEIK
jgi:hypothetical protein